MGKLFSYLSNLSDKDKNWFRVYVIWFLLNLSFVLISQNSEADAYFWPFEKTYYIDNDAFSLAYYDISEFVIYALLLPLAIYLFTKLNTTWMDKCAFTKSIKVCYRKYFTITGRASRSELWWFTLYSILSAFIFILGVAIVEESGLLFIGYLFEILGAIAFITSYIPLITVQVRRLHDVGRSGWLLLPQLIPYVGFIFNIINFVFFCRKSNDGPNKYGESL